jgi:hypothetical protein
LEKDADLEEIINQHASGSWEIASAIGDTNGSFTKVILERDKNK